MTTEYVQSFIDLIERFLERAITALDFEKKFLILWNEDKNLLEAFDTVEKLFFSVDEFTDLPLEPEDNPDNYINEDELRESAAKTLRELYAIKDA